MKAWKARSAGMKKAMVVVLAVALGGCVSYRQLNDPVTGWVEARQPQQALEALDAIPRSDDDRILYLLDRAMLLQLAGEFEASNAAFEQAKALREEIDAVSVSEEVGAISINETVRDYQPPPFERILIHLFEALNFLRLGDDDGARVEILQLVSLQESLEPDQTLPVGHYFAGLVFDHLHENSSALIELRKARERYQSLGLPTPEPLKRDLLRLTDALGLKEEHRSLSEAFGPIEWPRQRDYRRLGEVVVVTGLGLMPHRWEQSITVQSPRDGQIHRISTPIYEQRQPRVTRVILSTGSQRVTADLADRLDRHAEAELERQMPGIVARALARVAVKNRFVDRARAQDPLLGALINIATFATERADTRAWYTLPQELTIARLALPPGHYPLRLDYAGRGGAILGHDRLENVAVTAGRKTFFYTYEPDHLILHATRSRRR